MYGTIFQFKISVSYVIFSHAEASIEVPFASIESAMFKWRQKVNPPPVNSLSSYAITINSDVWNHLLNYREGTMNVSLLIADDFSHSVLFVNPHFVRKIAVRGTFYLDATFKVVPKYVGASQFLTILTRKYDHVSNFLY